MAHKPYRIALPTKDEWLLLARLYVTDALFGSLLQEWLQSQDIKSASKVSKQARVAARSGQLGVLFWAAYQTDAGRSETSLYCFCDRATRSRRPVSPVQFMSKPMKPPCLKPKNRSRRSLVGQQEWQP